MIVTTHKARLYKQYASPPQMLYSKKETLRRRNREGEPFYL